MSRSRQNAKVIKLSNEKVFHNNANLNLLKTNTMLKVILFSLITCAVLSVNAQVQTQVIGDSVFVHSNTGKGELILQNSTDSVNGFLFNKGAGRTEFKKALIALGNNKYLIGGDTLDISSAENGSSLSLTTTGTSGLATLSSGVLNIPNYSGWGLTGNSGINAAVNFLGTTDNNPLVLKVNNTIAGLIQPGSLYNQSFGYSALKSVTTGIKNVASGFYSLYQNTAGYRNTGIGYSSLYGNTTGGDNTAVGALAAAYLNGYNNTALGVSALNSETSTVYTGSNNTALGSSALRGASMHNNNIALGYNAGLDATLDNTLFISDSTKSMHFGLDSATGAAPSVIGKDNKGFWHTYATPAGGGGGSTPSLQQVTDVDSVTDHSLIFYNPGDPTYSTGFAGIKSNQIGVISLIGGSFSSASAINSNGTLTLTAPGSSTYGEVAADSIEDATGILEIASGVVGVPVMSINGIKPLKDGNVNISGGSGNTTLQQAFVADSTTNPTIDVGNNTLSLAGSGYFGALSVTHTSGGVPGAINVSSIGTTAGLYINSEKVAENISTSADGSQTLIISNYSTSSSNAYGINLETMGALPYSSQLFSSSGTGIASSMNIDRSYSSIPSSGFGTSLDFNLKSSAGDLLSNQVISSIIDPAASTFTTSFQITGIGSNIKNTLLSLNGNGQAQLNQYGSGTFTGTPTYNLGTDANGNIIETSLDGGGGSYILPIASTATLGGIKVGSGLSIDSSGILSAAISLLKPGSVPYAGPAGALIQDTTGLVYDGNDLQVGHSGFYNTTGLSLNGGRGYLGASGFGLTIKTNGGEPMDASKSISFYNSDTRYGVMSMRSESDSTLRFLTDMEIVPSSSNKYNLGSAANQWDTVFAKQLYINGSTSNGGISLTTVGTAGPATLTGSTLNIPDYSNGAGTSWNVTGNSGTTDSNFIGTTDNKSLLFKTNNILSGWIDVVNRNTTLGYSSLAVNTPTGGSYGRYNSAFGYDALQLNTTGYNNMGFGGVSLYNNTTGWDNAAIGVASLFSNSSGYGNVAIGRDAMRYNTTGYNNVGIGITALDYNSTGHGNTAIGWAAIWNNGVHSNNIGIGVNAGAGHNTEDNTMYISDSTHHMYFKLDSAIGTAPSIIGKDANGYWHVYQAPSGGNVVETTLVDSTVTLSSGTITVSDSRIKTGAKIFVTCNTPSGTQGFLSAPASGIVDGTSFVINSTSATDNSTVNYQIINP